MVVEQELEADRADELQLTLKAAASSTAEPTEQTPLSVAPILGVITFTLLFLFRVLLGSDVSDDALPQSLDDPSLVLKLQALASIDWIPRLGPLEDHPETAVLLVMTAAAFAQALTGFGFAIVAVGVLSSFSWILDSNAYDVVTPVVATLGAVVGGVLLLPNSNKLDWSTVGELLVPCTLLTPVGIYLSTMVDPGLSTSALGLLILAFVGYLTSGVQPPAFLAGERATLVLGAMAGLLGGAYDVQGPPLVISGTAKGWDPVQFRNNVLAVVAVNSASVVAIDFVAGKLDNFYYAFFCLTSLPGVLLGVAAGQWASERIDQKTFKQVILLMCSALSIKLLASGGLVHIPGESVQFPRWPDE